MLWLAKMMQMGFRHEWLNETFWMMSLGMGIVAVGSGALANLLVEWEGVGARAPSFAAAVVSTVCFLIIKSTWVENVGVRHISLSRPISNAFQALQGKISLNMGAGSVGSPCAFRKAGRFVPCVRRCSCYSDIGSNRFGGVLELWACAEKSVAFLGWAQASFDLAVAIFWLLWIPTLVVSFVTSSLDVTAVSCTILS
jgi:hypothetical protein